MVSMSGVRQRCQERCRSAIVMWRMKRKDNTAEFVSNMYRIVVTRNDESCRGRAGRVKHTSGGRVVELVKTRRGLCAPLFTGPWLRASTQQPPQPTSPCRASRLAKECKECNWIRLFSLLKYTGNRLSLACIEQPTRSRGNNMSHAT